MRGPFTRRHVVAGIAASGALLAARVVPAAGLFPTPSQTSGPYYPGHIDLAALDNDLVRAPGRTRDAIGEVLGLGGKVLDSAGRPASGALVEIWQADALGRYNHPADPADGGRDENFEGFGSTTANESGEYRFRTIRPAAYPPGGNWRRTPHIHFAVTAPGLRSLTTQMYFAGEPLNDSDGILRRMRDPAMRASIVRPVEQGLGGENAVQFNIVLLGDHA